MIFQSVPFLYPLLCFCMMEARTVNQLIIDVAHTTRPMNATEQADILRHVLQATFAPELLEVDEALWGSFWQGDVISPGYCLPAVELHLLRAIRLAKSWPETTTVEQFLADLRAAINQNGHVEVTWAAEQLCAVVTAVADNYMTVVRYNAMTGYLEAGYRLDYKQEQQPL